MKKLTLAVMAGCMSLAFTAATADQRGTSGVMHLAQATTGQTGTAGTATQPRNVQETQPAHSAPVPTGQPGRTGDAVGQTGPGTATGAGRVTTPGVGATADPAAPRTGAGAGAAATTTEREVTTRERTEQQRMRARPARQVKG